MSGFALVFAGQGSEEPEMGLALAREDDDAAALLAGASRVTGIDVPRALARGGRALEATEILKPVLLAVGLGIGRALVRRGVRPAWTAGHSLGELTAACFAADLGGEDAIALAAKRGALMKGHAGGMLALDAELAEVEQALVGCPGVVGLAAINAPREIVISGDVASLAHIERSFGARSKRLRVAGPWHSPLLVDAVAPFRAALERAFGDSKLSCRFASACSRSVRPTSAESQELEGGRAEAGRGPGATDLPMLLSEALVSPVRFADLLERLASEGISDVIVAAPSRVVRSLVRRTLSTRVTIHAADDPADLDRIARALA